MYILAANRSSFFNDRDAKKIETKKRQGKMALCPNRTLANRTLLGDRVVSTATTSVVSADNTCDISMESTTPTARLRRAVGVVDEIEMSDGLLCLLY